MENKNRSISGSISSDTIIEINGKKLEGDNIYFNEDYVAVDGIKRDDIEMKDFKFEVHNQSESKKEGDKENNDYFLIYLIPTFILSILLLYSAYNIYIFLEGVGSISHELASMSFTFLYFGSLVIPYLGARAFIEFSEAKAGRES